MKKLVAYQTDDALELQFPSPIADLVITSPPLDILSNRAYELFTWLDGCVSPPGLVILDFPGQYNAQTISLWEGERKTSWKFQWGFALHSFYAEGDTQSLCAYARYDVPKPKNIPYRRCQDRDMAHPCEFDSLLIKNLIEMFTEPHQMVLDPFCGTGMVPRTAYELERNGIGIDQRCPFTNRLDNE